MADQVEIRFRLKKFITISFSFEKIEIQEDLFEKVAFNHNVVFKLDPPAGKAEMKLTVEVFTPGNTQKIGSITTVSEFELTGFEGTQKDGKYLIPSQLPVVMASIAWSTTRGALMERGAGTVLAEIPLPTINPNLIISPSTPKEKEKEKIV